MKNYLHIIFILFFCSCAIAQKKKGNSSVEEDFSKYRPTYTYNLDTILAKGDSLKNSTDSLVATYSVNDKLHSTIDSIRSLNSKIEYVKAFKVLAYSGTDREMGMLIRKTILGEYPDWEVDLIYKQPYFKVMVGAYYERIDAVRINSLIHKIKLDEKDFKETTSIHSLVVPDKLKIR